MGMTDLRICFEI